MTALLAQRLIAAPFLILGSWCLFFPEMVERLGVRPDHYQGTAATALSDVRRYSTPKALPRF